MRIANQLLWIILFGIISGILGGIIAIRLLGF